MTAADGWYRHVNWALVRTGTGVLGEASEDWPAAGSDVEGWAAWIDRVWSDRQLAEAVGVASPGLAGAVGDVLDGRVSDPVRARQAAVSLARYAVRARRRATPFGLFAGVAAVRFGGPVDWRSTDVDRVRTRADAAWLASVIGRLESDRAVLRRLWVTANDLTTTVGGRVSVCWPPSGAVPGPSRRTKVSARQTEVSVRLTAPVELVLRSAVAPVAVTELLDQVAAAFPHAPAGVAEAMVAELVRYGLLVTNLRPPSTVVDGPGHVLSVLQPAAAGSEESSAEVGDLRAARRSIMARPRRSAGGRWQPGPDARPPLAIDLQVGDAPVLPAAVAIEGAAAAEALLRLSPAPAGTAAWRAYYKRFVERFGVGSAVRLTHMVDPVTGIGLPDHGAGVRTAAEQARDGRLAALAQQAALDGAQEVVLDDADLDALAVETADRRQPVPHLDLTVEVHADTAASLEAGRFAVAVTGIGRTALATSGRFLDLLSTEDREWIGALPTRVDGAVAAQLSVPPHPPRMGNVTRVPQVLSALISLAEHRRPTADRVPLSDLAVTADRRRLYLVSLSRRRVVEPVLANAAAWHTLPDLARLLAQLPHALDGTPGLFDWGTADCLPFRPRLRYRRTILAPARWRVPANALPGPVARWDEWCAAIQRLRDRLRLPAWVSVGRGDRRLRLHLEAPMDLTLLREHVDAVRRAAGPSAGTAGGGEVVLAEAPGPDSLGWCGGRAHEIVIPLVATSPPTPAPAVLSRTGPLPLIDLDSAYLPGSSVLSAKLYAATAAFDVILTEHLPALLSDWDTPPVWWFVRYHDPAPHLRLRIRTGAYGRDVERVGAWAASLRGAGLTGDLTLDIYHPETARYGAGPAMTAAEELFAADSAAAVAQLAATGTRRLHPDAVTAASLLDLATGVFEIRDAALRWLIAAPDVVDLADRAGPLDRAVLSQTLALSAAEPDHADPTAPMQAGPEEGLEAGLTDLWRARRHAAAAFAVAADHDRPPATVAVSLLHLHHNRAHSADAGAEARTHKLARAVALAHRANPAHHAPTRSGQP